MQPGESASNRAHFQDELLAESERRFRAIFEQAAVGMARVDLNGKWLEVNQSVCKLTGYSQDELLNLSFQQLTYPADLDADLALLADMLAGTIPSYSLEKRFLRKDGSLIWVNLTVALVRDDAGEPLYFISVIEDFNARKQLEEERAQFLEREQATLREAAINNRRLSILQRVSDTALSTLRLDELLPGLLEQIRQAMQAENSAILLMDEDGRELRAYIIRGPEEEVATLVHVPVGKGVAGRIAASRAPLIIGDLSQVEVVTALLRERFRSLVGVPLIVDDRVIGVLHVDSVQPQRYTQEDARLLQLIGDRIALAIDHARLYQSEQATRQRAAERAGELETIFEAMTDGVVVYDRSGQVIRTNQALRTLFALDAVPEHINLPLEERMAALFVLRDTEGKALSREEWPQTRILRGERLQGAQAMDIHISAFDGRELDIRYSGGPLLDSGGQIIGAVGIIEDVTERHRLERRTRDALDALLHMAESLVELPIGETHLPRLQVVAARLVELSRSALGDVGVAIAQHDPATGALHPLAAFGLPPAVEAQWQAGLEGQLLSERYSRETQERLCTGEVVQIDLRQPANSSLPNLLRASRRLLAPMLINQRLIGFLALERQGNVLPFSADEEALAGAVAQLCALVLERERLLGEREAARGHALALREANERMDNFLGIASHELKTPLTTIKMHVQLAERRLEKLEQEARTLPPDTLPERILLLRRQLDRSEIQMARLTRLINDLLDVSRIQAGKLIIEMEPVDLAEVVREATEGQQQHQPFREIRLTLPPGPVLVYGDADRLGQVVTNYLTNALKYSPPEEPVEARLEIEREQARVWVHDQGPGIAPGEQEHIWERFYRAPTITVQSGSGVGLGLGLHISWTIIERHNGQVGVASTPGEGATFWFTLPLFDPLHASFP